MSQQQVHDNLTAIPDNVLCQVISLLPFADRCHLQRSCRKLYSLSKQSHFYRGLDHLNIALLFPERYCWGLPLRGIAYKHNFCLYSAKEPVKPQLKTLLRSEYSVFFNLVTLAASHLSVLSFKFLKGSDFYPSEEENEDENEVETAFANLISTIFEHMAAHWPHVIREIVFDLCIITRFTNSWAQEFSSCIRRMQESLARFPNLHCVRLKIDEDYLKIDDYKCNVCKEFIAGAFPHLSDVTLNQRLRNNYWGLQLLPTGLLLSVEQLTLQGFLHVDGESENLDRILRLRQLRFRKCYVHKAMSRTYHLPYLTNLTYEESQFFYHALDDDLAFYDVIEAPNLRHFRLTSDRDLNREVMKFVLLDWNRIGQKYPLLESIAITCTLSMWFNEIGLLRSVASTYTGFVQKLLACASRLPNLTHLHLRTYGMGNDRLHYRAVKPLTESVWRDMLDALQAGCPNLQSIRLPFLCENLYVDWLLDLFQVCRSLRRIHCDALCAGVGWVESSGTKCQQFITHLAESLHNTSVVLSGSFFVGFPGLSRSLERLPLTEKFPSVMVTYTGQCHIIHHSS